MIPFAMLLVATAPLQLQATLTKRATLLAGDERAAVWTGGTWVTFGKESLIRDAKLGATLSQLERAHDGRVYFGRSPLVLGAKGEIVRVGKPVRTTLPSGDSSLVSAGTIEAWQIVIAHVPAVFLIDGEKKALRLPSGPRLGTLSPIKGFCELMHPWRMAWMRGGIAILQLDCDPDADGRVIVVAPDGKRHEHLVRAYAPLLEANQFAMRRDGKAVLAGIARGDGRFALAIETDDGSWRRVLGSERITIISHVVVDARGDVWSISLGTGPDGKDIQRLHRNTDVIALAAPDGRPLRLRDLAFDARAGIILHASAANADFDEPTWLFAQAPVGKVEVLP